MTPTARALAFVLSASSVGLVGCGDEQPAARSDPGKSARPAPTPVAADRGATAKADSKLSAEPPIDPKPADPTAAPVADGKIGVAECDEYIEKYATCIIEKVPVEARPHMKEAMELSARAWREAASGPSKDGVAATCKTALEAARQATESLGCDW